MSVSVTGSENLEPGPAVALFPTRIADRGFREPLRSPLRANYELTRDGQKFLIDTVIDDAAPIPTTVVLNWPAVSSHR